MSLLTAQRSWTKLPLKGLFQPNPFYDSVVLSNKIKCFLFFPSLRKGMRQEKEITQFGSGKEKMMLLMHTFCFLSSVKHLTTVVKGQRYNH